MTCKKCGRETEFKQPVSVPGVGMILAMRSHADAEKYAWFCPTCRQVYCGECCLPEWQGLKAKEGLSGPELAAKLDRTPSAFFDEKATCPNCKVPVESEEPRRRSEREAAAALARKPNTRRSGGSFGDEYLRMGGAA